MLILFIYQLLATDNYIRYLANPLTIANNKKDANVRYLKCVSNCLSLMTQQDIEKIVDVQNGETEYIFAIVEKCFYLFFSSTVNNIINSRESYEFIMSTDVSCSLLVTEEYKDVFFIMYFLKSLLIPNDYLNNIDNTEYAYQCAMEFLIKTDFHKVCGNKFLGIKQDKGINYDSAEDETLFKAAELQTKILKTKQTKGQTMNRFESPSKNKEKGKSSKNPGLNDEMPVENKIIPPSKNDVKEYPLPKYPKYINLDRKPDSINFVNKSDSESYASVVYNVFNCISFLYDNYDLINENYCNAKDPHLERMKKLIPPKYGNSSSMNAKKANTQTISATYVDDEPVALSPIVNTKLVSKDKNDITCKTELSNDSIHNKPNISNEPMHTEPSQTKYEQEYIPKENNSNKTHQRSLSESGNNKKLETSITADKHSSMIGLDRVEQEKKKIGTSNLQQTQSYIDCAKMSGVTQDTANKTLNNNTSLNAAYSEENIMNLTTNKNLPVIGGTSEEYTFSQVDDDNTLETPISSFQNSPIASNDDKNMEDMYNHNILSEKETIDRMNHLITQGDDTIFQMNQKFHENILILKKRNLSGKVAIHLPTINEMLRTRNIVIHQIRNEDKTEMFFPKTTTIRSKILYSKNKDILGTSSLDCYNKATRRQYHIRSTPVFMCSKNLKLQGTFYNIDFLLLICKLNAEIYNKDITATITKANEIIVVYLAFSDNINHKFELTFDEKARQKKEVCKKLKLKHLIEQIEHINSYIDCKTESNAIFEALYKSNQNKNVDISNEIIIKCWERLFVRRDLKTNVKLPETSVLIASHPRNSDEIIEYYKESLTVPAIENIKKISNATITELYEIIKVELKIIKQSCKNNCAYMNDSLKVNRPEVQKFKELLNQYIYARNVIENNVIKYKHEPIFYSGIHERFKSSFINHFKKLTKKQAYYNQCTKKYKEEIANFVQKLDGFIVLDNPNNSYEGYIRAIEETNIDMFTNYYLFSVKLLLVQKEALNRKYILDTKNLFATLYMHHYYSWYEFERVKKAKDLVELTELYAQCLKSSYDFVYGAIDIEILSLLIDYRLSN